MPERCAHSRSRPVARMAAGLIALVLIPSGPALAAGSTTGPTSGSGSAAALSPGPTASSEPIILRAEPVAPVAGQAVQIVATGASPSATDFRWSLPGATSTIVDTGAQPWVSTSFLAAGPHSVSVTVTAPAGQTTATLSLDVAAATETAAPVTTAPVAVAPAPSLSSAPPVTTSISGRHQAAPHATGHGSDPSTTDVVHAVARAAADPAVSIVDFSFSPGTTTIHVGDTITWTNSGQQPHTATASNGSFDTGILKHGASASHTFSQAGTFSYICSVHPYMKGTVVVLGSSGSSSTSGGSGSPSAGSSSGATGSTGGASGTGSTGSTGAAGSTGSPSTAAATPSGASLPMTGMDLWVAALIGALMLLSGVALRAASRHVLFASRREGTLQ